MTVRVHPLKLPPLHLLACPNCGAVSGGGLVADRQYCTVCSVQYFDLAGLPCWFPKGVQQKDLWNTELGLTLQGAAQKLEYHQRLREQVDILPSARERLANIDAGLRQTYSSLSRMMADAGLSAEINPQYVENCPNNMLHFLDLLLRDWAWDTDKIAPNRVELKREYNCDSENKHYSENKHDSKNNHESENDSALRRVKEAFEASGSTTEIGDVLVLGAGAGRLSWDIHRSFKPSCTVALDISPLLAITAHQLISQQKSLALTELPADLQAGLELQQLWQLKAPQADAELAKTWFFVAADAWCCPLQPSSFDVVVTPWFIDVSSRDIRDLIALVSKLLKPGGRWINSGPLLYSKNLQPQQRYAHAEVVELMALAGFSFAHHGIENTDFLSSPLLAKGRREQVWTFAAHAPPADFINRSTEFPPAWLQLPHLPIPKNIAADPQGQPVLIHLLSLLDDRISLNQIAAQMAPNLSADEDALSLMKSVFGEMLLASGENLKN